MKIFSLLAVLMLVGCDTFFVTPPGAASNQDGQGNFRSVESFIAWHEPTGKCHSVTVITIRSGASFNSPVLDMGYAVTEVSDELCDMR